MPVANYIPKGVNELASILPKLHKPIIYYDPDIDGAVTGELLRRFLTAYQVPYRTHLNENRQHGMKLSDSKLDELKGSSIFLVDAGISVEEMKRVTSKGINIINIDHHHIDHEELVFFQDEITGCYALMINNQYPFEPEQHRYLSGAGVMYYVLHALHPNFCKKDEEALVGLTLLSDIRPLETNEAREFLYTTFTHQSPQMEYLLTKTRSERSFSFGEQKFDRNYIDYTFSPKINALFRLNMGEHAISLFKGEFQLSADELDFYRTTQKRMKEAVVEKSEGQEFSHFVYYKIESDAEMPYNYDMTNFIGYACSETANKGKTAFMTVMEGEKVKRGSVRGKYDVDYLSLFKKYGFKAEGHPNAFGVISVDISKVDLESLNKDIEELEKEYEKVQYEGRLLPVSDLSFFVGSNNVKIAELNNYLRDSKRFYIQYNGNPNNIIILQRGKVKDFIIDGVKVLCFEPDLEFKDALILPVLENNRYVNLFLKRK